jgi:O-methyltransferase
MNLSILAKAPKILLLKMLRNKLRVRSATGLTEQLTVVRAIRKAPPGAIVECGTYLGGSAVNLSLACRETNRDFVIFDSFEGLPEPAENDRSHFVLSSAELHQYSRGAWKGTFDTVKQNIAKYGSLQNCKLVKGYFEQTLPSFHTPVAVVFCDADLLDSVKTCLLYLWPLLVDGGYFFTHEAHHLSIAKLFYDDLWWKNNLGHDAPGLIGAGSGLGLSRNPDGTFGSCIGYVIKNPTVTRISNETGLDRTTALTSPGNSARI